MGRDIHEPPGCFRRHRGIEESLHFAATAVNRRGYGGKFRLKSGQVRRMVLTSAVLRGLFAQPAELPPLFLQQREGLREHAVALRPLTGEVVSGWLALRSLPIKEIGYGQQ
jgi:hypothetical protein